MKPLVKLVNEWDAYESKHSNASIEDFCRFYLIKKREEERKGIIFSGGAVPPSINSILLKMLSRISAINFYYFKISSEKEDRIEPEWFLLLNSIFFKKESKKIDVINANFIEQSTGVDMLKRMKKAGLISERNDLVDKRAVLVKLTQKGEGILFKCFEKLSTIGFFMFQDVNEDDKNLVLQLLSNTEIKHSRMILENRTKNFDEILDRYSDKEKLNKFKKVSRVMRAKAIKERK